MPTASHHPPPGRNQSAPAHRLLELVLFQLRPHTPRQAIPILLIAKPVFYPPDLVVRSAHQGLDQQLPSRLVPVIPEIGPVRLALPAAQRRGIARLHQVRILVLEPRADVLGDVDAFALRPRLHQPLVLGSQLHHLLVREPRQDLDQRLRLGCALLALERPCETRRVVRRVREPRSAPALLGRAARTPSSFVVRVGGRQSVEDVRIAAPRSAHGEEHRGWHRRHGLVGAVVGLEERGGRRGGD
ncbi:hypothetical protein VTI74DRAFT_2740 [Chaetomium olivicolor]